MTTKRPWFPFNVVDYRADTHHLTTLEHGVYHLLIEEYWMKGGLPDDDRRLAIIAKLPLNRWKFLKEHIEKLFLPHWRHKRIDKEIAKTEKISAIKRTSAEVRWGEKKPNDDAYAYANGHAYAYTRARDSTIEHKNIGSHLDLDPTLTIKNRTSINSCPSQAWTLQFDEFWKAWPNKVGKPTARKVFEKVAKRPDFDYEAVLEGVRRYQHEKPADRPWLNPSTFLNQERWNDQPASVAHGRGRSNGMGELTEWVLEGIKNGDEGRREESPSEIVPLLPLDRR